MLEIEAHGDDVDEVVQGYDPHFDPIISLPPVLVKTLEEDEEEMVKLRAKLYRYETGHDPHEWKERGTGDVKILKHHETNMCRILMRRDKTLKICANHHVLPDFELKPKTGCNRAWVWMTSADFADEDPKEELLAIRFTNVENAQKFKDAFEEAKKIMARRIKKSDMEKSISNNDTLNESCLNNESAKDDNCHAKNSLDDNLSKNPQFEVEVKNNSKNASNSQIQNTPINSPDTNNLGSIGDKSEQPESKIINGNSQIDISQVSSGLTKLVVREDKD